FKVNIPDPVRAVYGSKYDHLHLEALFVPKAEEMMDTSHFLAASNDVVLKEWPQMSKEQQNDLLHFWFLGRIRHGEAFFINSMMLLKPLYPRTSSNDSGQDMAMNAKSADKAMIRNPSKRIYHDVETLLRLNKTGDAMQLYAHTLYSNSQASLKSFL